MGELYAAAAYFTMQTLTTVGYGDITISSTAERILCIILQFVGVIFFSFAAGSMTNIISKMDHENDTASLRTDVLNKILTDYKIPQTLYFQLLIQKSAFDDNKTLNETKNFLNDLPYHLKIKTCMHLYQELYELVPYLNKQTTSFLGWICPLLKQTFMPEEEYIFQESDNIEDIVFIVKGSAGYVLPFESNIVFIEIQPGDQFGEIDVLNASL